MSWNVRELCLYCPVQTAVCTKKKKLFRASVLESGSDLSSRAVSSQVLSALKGLTSVFGMGTGGTPSSLPPEIVNVYRLPLSLHFPLHGSTAFLRPPLRSSASFLHPDNCTSNDFVCFSCFLQALPFQLISASLSSLKSSPRPISIIKLHTLLRFHR